VQGKDVDPVVVVIIIVGIIIISVRKLKKTA
jgi:hypothetical protein